MLGVFFVAEFVQFGVKKETFLREVMLGRADLAHCQLSLSMCEHTLRCIAVKLSEAGCLWPLAERAQFVLAR